MKRKEHEAGASLVVTVLGTTIVLALLMAITATVTLRSKRSAVDNQAALAAQYASEAALARARSLMNMHASVVNKMLIKTGTQPQALMAQLGSLCGNNGPLSVPTNLSAVPAAGQVLCTIPTLDDGSSDARLGFFVSNSVQDPAMTNVQWVRYWKNLLKGPNNVLLTEEQGKLSNVIKGNVTAMSTVTGGMVPQSVRLFPSGAIRVMMTATPLVATTRLLNGTREVALRRYSQGSPTSVYVELARPSFSQYQYFVNRRLTPDGNRLVFWDRDRFEGKVHANGEAGESAPLFYANSTTGGPRFYGKYTSTAPLEWSPGSPARVPEDEMFLGGANFGVDEIALPTNANDQRLASVGLAANQQPAPSCMSASNPATACLQQTFGTMGSDLPNGVYAAKPGTNAFAGGIYVKGDVSDLRVTKSGNLQRIDITQGTTTTSFRQIGPEKWEKYVNNSLQQTLNSSFNGMLFVEGNVGTADPAGASGLRGDGTAAGDLADDTRITVAARGDIFIKDNLTYSQNPASNPAANNVMGIYSETGNIKVNGPTNTDLTIDATLMAAAPGKGFGTVNYKTGRGDPQPKVRITGGIIEEQSQGVGTTSRLVPLYEWVKQCTQRNSAGKCTREENVRVLVGYDEEPGAGYSRDFRWDARFDDGSFAPPFFPTQQNYQLAAELPRPLIAPRDFKAEANP
ncbi:hypothetical protein [Deinococcus hohokamensis]|uniref:DUF4900 domain-containing protein n=1 Tax=Deinococcus hohokamensis TaxID=309883 RepID=A0ABV9I8T4_9DEIO